MVGFLAETPTKLVLLYLFFLNLLICTRLLLFRRFDVLKVRLSAQQMVIHLIILCLLSPDSM